MGQRLRPVGPRQRRACGEGVRVAQQGIGVGVCRELLQCASRQVARQRSLSPRQRERCAYRQVLQPGAAAQLDFAVDAGDGVQARLRLVEAPGFDENANGANGADLFEESIPGSTRARGSGIERGQGLRQSTQALEDLAGPLIDRELRNLVILRDVGIGPDLLVQAQRGQRLATGRQHVQLLHGDGEVLLGAMQAQLLERLACLARRQVALPVVAAVRIAERQLVQGGHVDRVARQAEALERVDAQFRDAQRVLGLATEQRELGLGLPAFRPRLELSSRCLPQVGCRARKLPVGVLEPAEHDIGVGEAAGDHGVLRRIGDALGQHAHLGQHVQRFIERTELEVAPAQSAEQHQLHLRLVAVLEDHLADLRQALEHVFRGHRTGVRIREIEQVQAGGRTLRVELGLRPALVGLDRLPCSHARAHGQRERDGRCRRKAPSMAHRELRRPVADRIRARSDRLRIQVAAQVLGHLHRRGIALCRRLLQRLGDDVLEVAFECPRQLARCGRALPGQAVQVRRFGVRGRRAVQDGGWQARRVVIDDGLKALDRRRVTRRGGMLAAQQDVQQDAEGIYIGGRRHRMALDLFGRRVVGREGSRQGLGRIGGRRGGFGLVEQLGDAEVEELHLTTCRDEDVRGLQVAMQDQVAVGMRNGRQHVDEQPDPRLDIELSCVAPAVDRGSLDVLENQIGLARGRDASVEQLRNVRMRQARKDVALASKSLRTTSAQHSQVDELDRHLPLEPAVVALRQPDASHAAAADRRCQRVVADRLAFEARLGRQGAAFEEVLALYRGLPSQQSLEFTGKQRVFAPDAFQLCLALGGIGVEKLVQQRAEHFPADRIDVRHGEEFLLRP